MALIRVSELAKKRGITREAMYYYIKKYKIPTEKKTIQIDQEAVFIDEHCLDHLTINNKQND
jgi:hypothetical protein